MKLFGALMLAAALPVAQAQDTAASRAGFMAGCWERSGTSTVRETWRMASPDFLIGTSTTVANGAVREFEFLRVESKAGVVSYIAQPKGVPPTSFTLEKSANAEELLFVNMQHDFPKRIGYQKVGADGLTAFIDGGEGTRKITFPMKKVSCQ